MPLNLLVRSHEMCIKQFFVTIFCIIFDWRYKATTLCKFCLKYFVKNHPCLRTPAGELSVILIIIYYVDIEFHNYLKGGGRVSLVFDKIRLRKVRVVWICDKKRRNEELHFSV